MKIGFAPSGRRPAGIAVELAVRAEQLGFAEVWVSEDYLERGAFTVAGGIAAATSTVTIGLGVINPWTRHVGLAAMEAAALDELSVGRLVVGLGASNERWMTGQLGMPFDKPISRLVEYAQAMRTLLDGDRLSGVVGGLTVDTRLSFRPTSDHVPIFFGVKGPRALRLGSELSDGLMLSVLSSPPYVEWIRATYSPKHVTAYLNFSVDADGDAARDRVRAHTGRFLGVHGASLITEKGGLSAERAEEFRGRLLTGADASDLVDDELLATFAVAGTPAECAVGLRRFAEAGVDSLVVMDDGATDPRLVCDGIADAAGRAGFVTAR